ncbi:damage-control phosphatase ARMT1 family protein [Helicobacter sp. MIT 21-1697]|uniref:damage-control phosphatase ARMT1 family protein n=1 Tax=Helicobacter sp. MIT 21-1697 TaxID=2993733 RepID=UPI00224AE521|nr:damage-control phosphatase ARMT1 family protein [Helicobacter sp. MIT 21-1697]MCX2716326.1 damage-control phosphatase ARMT1 family protein [Helicobacter sp. MIT 21-1697]
MIAQDKCFDCLQKQVENLCLALKPHNALSITQHIKEKLAQKATQTHTLAPPQIAIEIYQCVEQNLGISDPFMQIKQESMVRAHNICENLLASYPAPLLERTSSGNLSVDSIYKRLDWAIRMAILGNVIDYGSQSAFDFESADFNFEEMIFGDFCLNAFCDRLERAKILLYLADNAGENIFDEVLISSLKEIYPQLHIYYAVRGKPIINDLTLQDMRHPLAKGIERYCTLIDSGVRSPGFVYANACESAQKLYDEADVILCKGMGNFECLESYKDERLFMLFKVKCDVVADFCGVQKGIMMFRHNVK